MDGEASQVRADDINNKALNFAERNVLKGHCHVIGLVGGDLRP